MQYNLVYCDDYKNITKYVDKNSVDLVLIDPPYGINYTKWDKKESVDYHIIAKLVKYLLKPNGSFFCFAGWSNVCEIISILKHYFILKDWIIYDRIKGRGAKKSLVSTREDLLWFINNNKNYIFNKEEAYSTIPKKTKGMGEKNGKKFRALSNVWTDISPIVPWSKERVKHPTQKPLKLIERIIKVFTNENDLVVDFFAGSGTTAVACKKLNRKFIVLDNNFDYCTIIKNRLKNGDL